MCYEKSNVESVIEVGAVELLAQCLGHEDEELKANAAGAIQSIVSIAHGTQGRGEGHIYSILFLFDPSLFLPKVGPRVCQGSLS